MARLAREIWTAHYTPIIGRAQVEYMLEKFQSAAAIAARVENGYAYYLIYSGDTPAGYFAVVPDKADASMMLSKIYVAKRWRGRGLGRTALAFVEELAKDAGLRKLWLTVNKHNTASIAWYEHVGFLNAGPVVADIGGGFVMDDYRFEKEP